VVVVVVMVLSVSGGGDCTADGAESLLLGGDDVAQIAREVVVVDAAWDTGEWRRGETLMSVVNVAATGGEEN
jgi:hypothetical protein